ncbi:MAG: MbtH family NRPS accessory protein [Arenicella sp.]|nr:MbtH family NRPS accessory protein [Arenicella sp.]
MFGDSESLVFRVVYNHEEQYSIWLVERELPLGWSEEGKTGSKEECLNHIEKIWTDMRPLSLRKFLAEQQAS